MAPLSIAGFRLGLALLGAGLLFALAWAAQPAGAEEQNPVLARVNQHEITLADVYKQIESLPLGDQIDLRDQIDRFTNSLITEEVLFQSVLATDFEEEQELRARIKSEVVTFLIEKHVRGKIKVSNEDIRAYYAKNRDLVRGLHVNIRQIVMKRRAQCEAVRKRIKAPTDFAKLARAHSLDKTSAAKGGEVGLLMPVQGPNSLGFELELFSMSLGEMRIFQSREGCHLVQVTEIVDPPDPPFAQVRAYVRPILEREQEQALLEALIAAASGKVRVERVPPPAN
ncbi:MAG: peptidylprolyl isomerase [SAR324 cluster bacterium]|nr:peptidylprolyl isomerase [SAR324 cluster bacterium]